jgi:hypothetical protein
MDTHYRNNDEHLVRQEQIQRDQLTSSDKYRSAMADNAKTRATASGAAKPASAGNMNAFAAREEKEMGPINVAQRQSQEIRGLLATDDPAARAQLVRLLSNYMNVGRTTNQLYLDNKDFGKVYERMGNAISRWSTGDYTDKNKAMILEMVNKMDDNVFNKARTKLVTKFKKQAELMKIDPAFSESPNSFGDEGVSGWSAADEARLKELEAKHGAK